MAPMYYRNAVGALAVLDVTKAESLHAVKGFVNELRDRAVDVAEPVIVLVTPHPCPNSKILFLGKAAKELVAAPPIPELRDREPLFSPGLTRTLLQAWTSPRLITDSTDT